MTLDALLALETGDDFTYRGRTHTHCGAAGWTWGAKNGHEYADVPVFKAGGGGKKFIRVYYTEATR
ncbi:hypothetical protein EV193_104396 [Herbihabitans rhizosphaerae]|uniref:Uncharacterized protein n=1 Tax=Herbihabitans rhizosphaerae TaxID=1872711 RepID=A0A4Q7KSS5_9PSEU|nr:hypothetical protein [Herbihabitans rhizosphaerae]RZS39180.1 hypothetical protein EV193_104396 [Herbihabitans rhizosphaerae]